MSNVMKELKSEIVRLSRKEIKKELATPRKSIVAQRGLIAGLRRQVNAMQKELNALKRAMPAPDEAVLEKAEPKGRFWITGNGVKALRRRLGLTQANLGRLAGVTSNAVVKWEGKSGKINFRKATAGKIQGIRGLGKREVAEILGKGGKGKAKAKKA
jgi:DNA-binding transcriptional regulator YiaG